MHIHRDICHGMSALSWHPSQGQVQHILMSWHRAFCNLQWGVSALYCSSLNSLSFSQPLSSVIIPIAAFPPMGVPSLVWCYSHPAFKQKLTGAEYLPCTWDFWEVPSLRGWVSFQGGFPQPPHPAQETPPKGFSMVQGQESKVQGCREGVPPPPPNSYCPASGVGTALPATWHLPNISTP